MVLWSQNVATIATTVVASSHVSSRRLYNFESRRLRLLRNLIENSIF